MRDATLVELEGMMNQALENFEASSPPKRPRKKRATNQVSEKRFVAKPLKGQQDLFANDRQGVNTVMELSRQSRHFDERMMIDTMVIIGQGPQITIVIQPDESVGFAHMSVIRGEECTWTKRPIRREAVPAMLEMELPMNAQISWEFIESEQRVSEPLFKCDEVNS